MSNIHGLGSVKKAGPADKKHEEFSMGGAQRSAVAAREHSHLYRPLTGLCVGSGQAVLRPVKGGSAAGAGADPMVCGFARGAGSI